MTLTGLKEIHLDKFSPWKQYFILKLAASRFEGKKYINGHSSLILMLTF